MKTTGFQTFLFNPEAKPSGNSLIKADRQISTFRPQQFENFYTFSNKEKQLHLMYLAVGMMFSQLSKTRSQVQS